MTNVLQQAINRGTYATEIGSSVVTKLPSPAPGGSRTATSTCLAAFLTYEVRKRRMSTWIMRGRRGADETSNHPSARCGAPVRDYARRLKRARACVFDGEFAQSGWIL